MADEPMTPGDRAAAEAQIAAFAPGLGIKPENVRNYAFVYKTPEEREVAAVRAAVAEERKACAAVAEHYGDGRAVYLKEGETAVWHEIADAIRARGATDGR